jgi:hypothetical protein
MVYIPPPSPRCSNDLNIERVMHLVNAVSPVFRCTENLPRKLANQRRDYFLSNERIRRQDNCPEQGPKFKLYTVYALHVLHLSPENVQLEKRFFHVQPCREKLIELYPP